ncbi:MAG: hypothetical protein HY516_02040 [Candidatus Aenigmarchaeota archaeon]|nr:hypothetical protein [Candidatus Aenigmarchaeota archaeon]
MLFISGISLLWAGGKYSSTDLSLIGVIIWLFSVIDAYLKADKTINEEPDKRAIWCVVFVFVLIFIAGLLATWSTQYMSQQTGNYTTIQSSTNLQKYSEMNEKTQKELQQFSNKLTESSLSLSAGDTLTSRTKISEARNLLINIKSGLGVVCDFQENNKGLFGSGIENTIQTCKGFLDLSNLCWSKYLDSLYSVTYLEEQRKQVNNQTSLQNYQNSCNSWLNDYNVVRGGCNTISQKYSLDFKIEDISSMCKTV